MERKKMRETNMLVCVTIVQPLCVFLVWGPHVSLLTFPKNKPYLTCTHTHISVHVCVLAESEFGCRSFSNLCTRVQTSRTVKSARSAHSGCCTKPSEVQTFHYVLFVKVP